MCVTSKTPILQTVAGKSKGVVFTPSGTYHGVGDQASATFIITPNGGSPLWQPNDSFVAQRAPSAHIPSV